MSVIRLGGDLVRRAYEWAVKGASSAPAAVAKAGARIGLTGAKATVQNVLRAAKDNPVTTALVLYEVYGLQDAILQEMMDADPEIRRMIELFDMTADRVEDTKSAADIVMFTDEFRTIENAARRVGGFNNLMELRNALALDNKTYMLYQQVKQLARTTF